jgi:hypothetical protein
VNGIILLLITIALLAGCGKHSGGDEHSASLLKTIEAAEQPNANAGLSSEPSEAPLVTIESLMERPEFQVRSREAAITKFPCQKCHRESLERVATPRKAHWDVELRHASESVMACSTCHLGSDLNSLRTLAGTPVSFDRSDRLCAQCHSRQATDWAGGAHGKRVGGWAPPRVVQTCVECHNPHAPAWDKRWPAHAGRAPQ